MTTQQELAQLNSDIEAYEKSAHDIETKIKDIKIETDFQKQVLQQLEKRDKEKKDELNQINRDNLELTFQIEEAELEITKLKQLVKNKQKEDEAKAIGEDSFLRDLESNFKNIANVDFQAISPRFR